MRVAGLVILTGVLGLVLAACGSSGPGVVHGEDLAKGRELFVNGDGGQGDPTCGSCHTLAAAGSSGVVGPNLDDAFRGSREDGFDESTFEQVVREQISYPGIGLGMPADLLGGTDADNVAFFVAHCAANEKDPACAPPDGQITATEGSEIFAQAGCGSCHTLAAVGSSGTVGPNLDETKPSVDLAVDRITNGAGPMPPFKDRMSEEQIKTLAEFVSQSAGA